MIRSGKLMGMNLRLARSYRKLRSCNFNGEMGHPNNPDRYRLFKTSHNARDMESGYQPMWIRADVTA